MAGAVERLAIYITGDASSAEAAFKKIGESSARSSAAVSTAQKAMAQFGMGTKELGAIGAGLAADVAAVKFGEHLVNQFADATAGVRQFQRVSGATAEDASRLVYASRILGVDTDKLGTAMFRLSHNLDGNKDALAKYGVTIAHTRDGGIDLTNTLLNVADAVHRSGEGAEANAVAFAAFGRQATALLPILLRGREGLQDLFAEAARHHEIFSQDDLAKGKQFTLATKEFHAALTGVEIEGGKALIPLATSVAKDGEQIVHFFDNVLGILEKARGLNRFLPGFLQDPAWKDAHKNQQDLAAAVSDAADAQQAQATAAAADAKALDAFFKATSDAADAQQSLEKAHRSVASAQRQEADATHGLNKLKEQGKVDADQVARAEKDVAAAAKATADAQRAEADATQRVADAQQAVLDAQAALEKVRQGASPEEVQRAELANAKAHRDRERAALAVADAEDKKNSIVEVGVLGVGQSTGTARQREQAELDLADALDGVKSADLDATDAQKNLDDTRNKGKDGSDDLKKAQEELKAKQDDLTKAIQDQADAHDRVIASQQAQVDAGDALKKAQAGDPDWDDKLAQAQQRVADAHQNTVDQINAERDAVDKLIQKQKDYVAAQQGAGNLNVQTSAIGAQDFRPVSRSVADIASGGNTYVTVNTGADPGAVIRAQEQYAARNGGSPRK